MIELHQLLTSQPALIVHFSGFPSGVGRNMYYPADLQYVLGNPLEPYCCSTIAPSDFAAHPEKATGYVGIVLAPLVPKSIIYVSHQDHGAPPSSKERWDLDRPVSIEDCARSLIRDGDTPYNEWLVGFSRVVGIFKAPQASILKGPLDEDGRSPDEILDELGDFRLFTSDAGQFIERQGYDDWIDLDMKTIY